MLGGLKGREFIRRIEDLGRRRGVPVRFDPRRGKGSHGTLFFGTRKTTVKDRKAERPKGLIAAMLKQLGPTRADLED